MRVFLPIKYINISNLTGDSIMDDKLKNGWEQVYKKRLLNENNEVFNNDDDRNELLMDLEAHKAKLDKKLSGAKIAYSSDKKTFDDFFKSNITGTYSVGKSHFPFTTYLEAKKVFEAAPDEKGTLVGDPGFTYELFLNDYKNTYDTNRAEGRPQGSISQKPSDPNYRKPNTVYNQKHLQGMVNEKTFPIVAVVMAGKENLESLKVDRPEIFEDGSVKMFLNTVAKEAEARKVLAEVAKVDERIQKLKVVKGFKAPQDDKGGGPSDPNIPMHAGPGRVQQEAVIAEEHETMDDMRDKNKQALNESWNKYQAKNKNVKNTEKPDDFTLLMG